MTVSTNVPGITYDASGITLPAEADIVTGRLADFTAAFGADLGTSLTSPQGQLAQSDAAIIGDKNDSILQLVNNLNPDVADGRWQDAIAQIYFIERAAGSGTVVACTCSGLVGTVIPAGSFVADSVGYLYTNSSAGTIGSDGTVIIDFQNTTLGPIACAIGGITSIYKSVVGWSSVTNATAGTLGVNVESRADFEYRRKLSVAGNAVNSLNSVYAAVLAVDGVVDAYVTDNSASTAVSTGSSDYSIAAHSIYIAVAGGSDEDVAEAIWSKKPCGCGYNGDTSYTVSDTSVSTTNPPQYVVNWVTPTAIPIYYNVTLLSSDELPSDIDTLVQSAIVSAFNGTDGGSRARIASTLYAGRYYAGVSAIDDSVEILSITLGSDASSLGTSVSIGIDQRPTLDTSNITVTLSDG